MITFLPHPDFVASARALDSQRLGKQRGETLGILTTLKYGGRYRNHPTVRMWEGCDLALAEYGLAICSEWMRRGNKDNTYDKIALFLDVDAEIKYPDWLGDERVHSSHRARLVEKYPSYYQGVLKWSEAPSLSYFWPV